MEQRRELASCYNALMIGAAADGDWAAVWGFLEELERSHVYNSIFRAASDRLLAEAPRRASAAEALSRIGTLVNWYARLGQTMLAEDTGRVEQAVQTALALGDAGHSLSVSEASVRPDSVCSHCAGRLDDLNLSQEDFRHLRESVFSVLSPIRHRKGIASPECWSSGSHGAGRGVEHAIPW